MTSRKQFELAMQSRYRSIDELFKVFARGTSGRQRGKYLRDEVQSMWEGWQLREQLSQGKKDVDGK